MFDLGKGNSAGFNVEAKIFADMPELTPGPEAFAGMILDSVRQHGMTGRVILQSFDPRILFAMKRLEPSIPRAALIEEDCDWQGFESGYD